MKASDPQVILLGVLVGAYIAVSGVLVWMWYRDEKRLSHLFDQADAAARRLREKESDGRG